jgi:gliding motility-associated-like protein
MTKKQIITLGILILTSFLGKAQTNLLHDGDFEDSDFYCGESNIEVTINVVSNNWFSGEEGGAQPSKFFGIWAPDCNLQTMNFWDPTYPPYQGDFSGWIATRFRNTNQAGNYNSDQLSICTEGFELLPNRNYYISLIARRDNTRGIPFLDYSFFEVVFTSDYVEKIKNKNPYTYSPKDTTYQSFYFKKDTIDFEKGFVKLDTCINLTQAFNALCFRFDEIEISPSVMSIVHSTIAPWQRFLAYWIDEVKIFDALEVEGNPCNVENHPENVSKFELPNIFTPNNDGINDFFVPIKAEIIEIEKVIIQNRWGQTVFESNEVNWDGNFQGKPTPDGTYFYIVTYKDRNEKMKSKSGTITLKR